MRKPDASREADERILAMLRLSDRGYPSPDIGKRYGLDGASVRAVISRVYRALRASEAA
jgi:DNA-binding NarL/FixJ family response regulator